MLTRLSLVIDCASYFQSSSNLLLLYALKVQRIVKRLACCPAQQMVKALWDALTTAHPSEEPGRFNHVSIYSGKVIALRTLWRSAFMLATALSTGESLELARFTGAVADARA